MVKLCFVCFGGGVRNACATFEFDNLLLYTTDLDLVGIHRLPISDFSTIECIGQKNSVEGSLTFDFAFIILPIPNFSETLDSASVFTHEQSLKVNSRARARIDSPNTSRHIK